MLFKFTLNLLGVTIIALALYGCHSDETDPDKIDGDTLSLKTGSGTATLESNGNVKVTATVHNGDDPAEGVEVVFSVKCGDTAVAFDKVITGADGVATATKAVAGATAATLGTCDVTASLNDEGSHVVRAKSGADTDPTPDTDQEPAEMKMGMAYRLSWDEDQDRQSDECDDVDVFKIEVSGELQRMGDWKREIIDQKIVVLPTRSDAGDCTLNDTKKTVIKFNKDAFSDQTPGEGCTPTTCWKTNGAHSPWESGNAFGDYDWIRKNGNNYVYHTQN